MDRQQILMAKTLEAADVPLSVQTFDNRLIIQKAVYLLQAAEIHMGYRFRWYLRGPYSPELANDVFGIVREGAIATEELRTWTLDEESRKNASSRAVLVRCKMPDLNLRAKQLELLASTLFLIKTGQTSADDAEKTARILVANEKPYSAEEVSDAVRELRANGLIA